MCLIEWSLHWHKSIVFKHVKQHGITGKLWDWFRDYLHGRTQRVVIKGQISSTVTITAGVPKGSILGPLMFIIYINDIVEHVDIDIRLWADDVTFHGKWDGNHNTENWREPWENQWLGKKTWLVIFNIGKTKWVKFTRKRQPEELRITMGNIEIANDRAQASREDCKCRRQIEGMLMIAEKGWISWEVYHRG